MPISQDDINKVKAANPGVALEQLSIDAPEFEFIAKKPPRGIYTVFLQQHEDGKGIEANETLCDYCIVYPDRATVQKTFEDFPSLPHKIAIELRKTAGADAKITRKKL